MHNKDGMCYEEAECSEENLTDGKPSYPHPSNRENELDNRCLPKFNPEYKLSLLGYSFPKENVGFLGSQEKGPSLSGFNAKKHTHK